MSSPGVVEALDVFEQGESGVGLGGKTSVIKQFASQVVSMDQLTMRRLKASMTTER